MPKDIPREAGALRIKEQKRVVSDYRWRIRGQRERVLDLQKTKSANPLHNHTGFLITSFNCI